MFYDIEDNLLPNFSGSIAEGGSMIFKVRLLCRAGRTLKSNNSGGILTVEGRILGDPVWVNLLSSFIDLSDYEGLKKTFEIKITADDNAGDSFEYFKLYQGS